MSRTVSSEEKILEALKLLKTASHEKRIELSEIIAGLYEKATEAGGEATEKVNDSAHEKPWLYVGGAAVAGFLLGLLARCRR